MPASLISNVERAAAHHAAVQMAKDVIGMGTGYLNPKAQLGSLSAFEWNKLSEAIISGWIIARSRQLTEERLSDENYMMATGEVPEPAELGVCSVALPALGDLCEKLRLSEKSVGEWTKEEILLFIHTAVETVERAKVDAAERPGPAQVVDESVLMAG